MKEIESIKEFTSHIKENTRLNRLVFQGVNLNRHNKELLEREVQDCIFMGCHLSKDCQIELIRRGNLIFPNLDIPFKIYRGALYGKESLYEGFDYKKPESYAGTTDAMIYRHHQAHGKGQPDTINESLLRRLHDHAITDALYDYLENWDDQKVVAIMGGHSLGRDHKDYLKIALISQKLVEKDYLMVSGGGPGGMEATHLGAWFAHRSESVLREAIEILAEAPLYNDKLWLSKAFEVIEKYPLKSGVESVGIPTWFYGHEPPTPFATHIAKYFANSVREEGLLAIAKGGIVFAPGSAGTIQEIFQEAAQNHYKTYGNVSPMIFLNTTYWQENKPVYPLLQSLAKGHAYADLLAIYDEPEKIVQEILNFAGK